MIKIYNINGKECLILEPKIKIIGRDKNGMFLIEYHDGTQCSQSKENILSLYSPVKEKVEVGCDDCSGHGEYLNSNEVAFDGCTTCGESNGVSGYNPGSGKTTRTVKRLELKQAIDIGIRQCNLSHEEIYSNYLDTNDKWLIVAYLKEKHNERKTVKQIKKDITESIKDTINEQKFKKSNKETFNTFKTRTTDNLKQYFESVAVDLGSVEKATSLWEYRILEM